MARRWDNTVAFCDVSSTSLILLPIEIHMTLCGLKATYRPILAGLLLLQSCLIVVSLLGGVQNAETIPADVHGAAIRLLKTQYPKVQ